MTGLWFPVVQADDDLVPTGRIHGLRISDKRQRLDQLHYRRIGPPQVKHDLASIKPLAQVLRRVNHEQPLLNHANPVAQPVASSRLCVHIKIVRPCVLSSAIKSCISLAASGSRPAVGSSRNSTLGSCSSARQIASFCRILWKSCPPGRRAVHSPSIRRYFSTCRAHP